MKLKLSFLTYLTALISMDKLLNTMLIYQIDFYLNEKIIDFRTKHIILT